MKHLVFLAAVLFSGCTEVPDEAEDAPAGAESPPPAAESAPQGLVGQYPLFRAAALEAAQQEMEESGEPPYMLTEEAFDVVDCTGDARNPDPRPPAGKAGLVELTARDSAFLDLNFARSGYPREVYAGPLRAHEERILKSILEGDGRSAEADSAAANEARLRLAAEVETNRARLRPDLPKVIALGECGFGESEYLIKLQPEGGRAWIANRFGFHVCRAKGVDPWDRRRCDRWDEVDGDRPTFLAGTYVYQAEWPGGAAGRGTKRLEPGDNPESVQTVTIRPD